MIFRSSGMWIVSADEVIGLTVMPVSRCASAYFLTPADMEVQPITDGVFGNQPPAVASRPAPLSLFARFIDSVDKPLNS